MKNVSVSRISLYLSISLCILQCVEILAKSSGELKQNLTVVRRIRQTETYEDGGCILPERPNFGRWVVTGNSYEHSSNKASVSTVLRLSCYDGYLSNSKEKYIACTGKEWSVPELPTCLKKCGTLNSVNYISAKCFNENNKEIECDDATHGARVTITCTPYYGSSEVNSTDRYCHQGHWNISEAVCTGCLLPEHPQYGNWAILGGNQGKPTDRVPSATVLKINCDENAVSPESPYIVCLGSQWNTDKVPTCLRKCPPPLSTQFATIRCYDNRKAEVKCDQAADGTLLKVECAPYCESSDSGLTRYCYQGNWDFPIPVCRPRCGEKKVYAEPLIVNGQKTEKGSYPWVAGVYRKESDNNYIFICGGSIISQKIILTAAHCVSDSYGSATKPEKIQVGVGKYYSKYNDPRDTGAQYLKIQKVIPHRTFRGEAQRYASDIAVLVTTEKIVLSKQVQPVCYQGLENYHLTSLDEGVMTGWGYTTQEGQVAEELNEINIPYLPDRRCQENLPPEWESKYFTFDKLCAGHFNKSKSSCAGDSGGGLYFKHKERYYIHGILSIHQSDAGKCNIEVPSLYTNVAVHVNWLQKIIAENDNAI